MVEPNIVHWIVEKHVLWYLSVTIEYGIRYDQVEGIKLIGYTDADWAGSIVGNKSTLG
jgi:hypothetical protein